MKWLLVIYFTGSSHWLPDSASYYPDKETCVEARDDLKKNPKIETVFCKPDIEQK